MIATKVSVCLVLLLLYLTPAQLTYYKVPKLSLQALQPKGFRVFLPDNDPRITLFLFDGIIREKSENATAGENDSRIWGFGVKKTLGWIYEDLDLALQIGQSINYQAFVSIAYPLIDRQSTTGPANLTLSGYTSGLRSFEVSALEDPKAHGPHCPITATKVRGKDVCAGEVIFEDNFDSFRDDLWQIEHYIPIDHPEHPFVSYQRLTSDPVVYANHGSLKIKTKFQETLLAAKNESILSGTLDLTSGCTDRICSMQAVGVDILPPIVTGRITSARFSFTYGTIYVRAKLPRGDWLYPEILLEPVAKKYGTLNYASGVLKIALALGNIDIENNRYGNNVLAGGPIINAKCRNALEFYRNVKQDGFWSEELHVYSLKWSPDSLVFSVDDVEYGRYMPGSAGLRSWLPASCRGPWYDLLEAGDTMAPFDDYFHITLGMAVGGTMEFPDGITTKDGKAKPWRNRGRKASLSFWQSKNTWLPTWTQPGLIVDYIKVVALD